LDENYHSPNLRLGLIIGVLKFNRMTANLARSKAIIQVYFAEALQYHPKQEWFISIFLKRFNLVDVLVVS
jgi:hypothetical protein